MIQTSDGSIVDENGKILVFSIERFVEDICLGDCCFICGKHHEVVEFNDEHVLPEWILRKYNLFNKSISLPNGTTFRYDQYKIPCCKECNQLMGSIFEKPISNLMSSGYNAVVKQLKTGDGIWLFFNWLSLIFLKTHLKDKQLQFNRRDSERAIKIADLYEWQDLHHIHCVARSFYTGININKELLGSFLVLPASIKDAKFAEALFDYGDLYAARMVYIRMDDIALISVLNDSCGSQNICHKIIEKITAPCSAIQLRELSAILAFANFNMSPRPNYFSEIVFDKHEITMLAELPDSFGMGEYDEKDLGQLKLRTCQDLLESAANKDEIENYLKQGKYTFLFDAKGRFIEDSIVLPEKPA